MATPLPMQLEKYGRSEALRSNCPFSIEDPDCVWIVRTGKLDLFAVETRDGKLYGARRHLMRVDAGEAVFGVGSHIPGTAIVASALPETEVVTFSIQHWRAPLPAVMEEPSALVLLENWIVRVGAALLQPPPSGPTLPVEPGMNTAVTDEIRIIVPSEGVAWVKDGTGNSLFMGQKELLASADTWLPLTRYTWLLGQPGSMVSCKSTLEMWTEKNSAIDSLREFHRIAMSFLELRQQQAEEKERNRLRTSTGSDAALVHSALLRLASSIHTIKPHQVSERACNDPIFRACEAIGNNLKVAMKPPPEMLRGLAVADPVGSIAAASGIRVRNVALKGEWWRRDAGPFLAFIEKGNRPVALLPRSVRSYEYFDPSSQQTGRVDQTVAAGLNPFAYFFYRSFPSREMRAWELLRFGLHGCRPELFGILGTGVAAGLAAIATPYVTGILFDRIIPGAEKPELLAASVLLLVVAIAIALFTFARNFAALRLEGKLDAALQSAVWDRLLSLPVSFFREYSSGDLAQRSLGISMIRQTLTGSTLTAIISGLFSIFSFALLFIYSWRLALLATVLVLLSCGVSLGCGVAQVRFQREITVLGGRISSKLLQIITGISKFKVSGTERRAFAAWARDFSELQKSTVRARAITNGLLVFDSVFPVAALAGIFFYHQVLMRGPETGRLSTGDFLAFLAAFLQFLTSALLLSSAAVSALSVVPMYERAEPILRAHPEVTEAKADPGRLTGAIEASRLMFRYKPDMPFVLRDVSFRITPGQFVAFVGASGSGKSTLFRLLLGFESPESGAVYYDNQDLEGLDVQALRRQIGVVLQSSRPVNGSIFSNIVGSAPLTIADAWEAARLAGIEQDIQNMPMGMHTHLADGGGGISGGQRQRLMIARAIVGRPRILLFDEATSALDNETQSVVTRSLESLQATRIVIAHRLSTVLRADVIFVMDKGRIVDSGSYQELILRDGIFCELARRQMT